MEVKTHIKKLRFILNQHNINYYVNDNPTISDSEYDKLLKELELLENEILIVDYLAKIYHVKIDDIKNNDIKNLDLQSINSNLSVVRVLDTLIYKKNLYVYVF